MRNVIIVMALLLFTPSALALPVAPPVTICGLEDTATGGDEACETAVTGYRALVLGRCALEWVYAERTYGCGAVSSIEQDGETYYVSAGPYGVYREANGCAGLQQAPGDCDGDNDEDPADDFLTLGEMTGL